MQNMKPDLLRVDHANGHVIFQATALETMSLTELRNIIICGYLIVEDGRYRAHDKTRSRTLCPVYLPQCASNLRFDEHGRSRQF